jgi:hypothetical protein
MTLTQLPLSFGGSTYNHERDHKRLGAQYVRVFSYMSDGRWHTLLEIAQATRDPEASVSARLRDFRKKGLEVEREYVQSGLHRYRLALKAETPAVESERF